MDEDNRELLARAPLGNKLLDIHLFLEDVRE